MHKHTKLALALIFTSSLLYGCQNAELKTAVPKKEGIENNLNGIEKSNFETEDEITNIENESETILEEESSIENELNELEDLNF